MRAHDASGVGNLLTVEDSLFFSSAVSDHCAAIANMFNATGDCTDEHVVEACGPGLPLVLATSVPRGVPTHRPIYGYLMPTAYCCARAPGCWLLI